MLKFFRSPGEVLTIGVGFVYSVNRVISQAFKAKPDSAGAENYLPCSGWEEIVPINFSLKELAQSLPWCALRLR